MTTQAKVQVSRSAWLTCLFQRVRELREPAGVVILTALLTRFVKCLFPELSFPQEGLQQRTCVPKLKMACYVLP